MSHLSLIQYVHSDVNPTAGCDGCPLWPAEGVVRAWFHNRVQNIGVPVDVENAAWGASFGADRRMRAIDAVKQLAVRATSIVGQQHRSDLLREIDEMFRCYAGVAYRRFGGGKGFARSFDVVEEKPGRMAEAAGWGPPRHSEEVLKPWLVGCPRIIFVSDMSDALSEGISFEYLERERSSLQWKRPRGDVMRGSGSRNEPSAWLISRSGSSNVELSGRRT